MFLSIQEWVRYQRNPNRCLICLRRFNLEALPCQVCKDKFIHRTCLRNYFRFNPGDTICFVCNTGELDYNETETETQVRSLNCNIHLNIPRRIPLCSAICKCEYFLKMFYFLFISFLFFIAGMIVFTFLSMFFFGKTRFEIFENGNWIFFFASGLVSIFLWVCIFLQQRRNPCFIQ